MNNTCKLIKDDKYIRNLEIKNNDLQNKIGELERTIERLEEKLDEIIASIGWGN
jgi:predicted RNase H-like nuclease (RuvC/YqgF family)